MATNRLPLGVTGVMLPELDFPEQIALCKRLGLTHYSLRPRNIPADQVGKPWGNWGNHKFDLTPARLVKEGKEIRQRLEDAGITPWGTVPATACSGSDDELKQLFEGSQIVGAGRVRIAPVNGSGYPQGAFNYKDALQQVIAGYKRAAALAKPYGQKIVIETHTGLIASSPALALNICREFRPEEIGVIFDMANFNIEGNYRPNLAVAVIADYIDHVHIGGVRRVPGTYDAQGFRKPSFSSCAMTEADLDIPGFITALHEAKVFAPLIIENYSENIPGALRLEESAGALKRLLATLN